MYDQIANTKTKLSDKEIVEKFCTKYNNNVKNLKRLTAKKSMDSTRWNKSLPIPLKGLEKVYVHPDQKDIGEQYVRIIHSKHEIVAVFGKHDFLEYSPEEDIEEDN